MIRVKIAYGIEKKENNNRLIRRKTKREFIRQSALTHSRILNEIKKKFDKF